MSPITPAHCHPLRSSHSFHRLTKLTAVGASMIVMASSLLAQEVLVDPPTPVVDAPAPVVDAPAPAVDAPPVNKMSAMADKLTPGQKDSLKAAMDVVQKSPELEKLHEEWQMAVSPEKKEQKAAEARQLLKKLLIQQDPSLEPLVSKFPN